MEKPPKVVAITGAAGYIGTRLLLQLETNLSVGKIVAFDRKPLPFPIHNLSFHQVDVAQSIRDLLRRHQVETLVHLACPYSHTNLQQNWPAVSRDNLEILEAVQTSCREAGVRHVIFLSSHRVYGNFPDNPVPVTESTPTRVQPGDFLGQATQAGDRAMRQFQQGEEGEPEKNGPRVTILRACTVLGFSDDHQRADHVFPYRFWSAGENPPFQFVHEVDLARLLEAVIQQEAAGIFNVAGEGVVFLRELADITRRKLTQLPFFLAQPVARLSSGFSDARPGAWTLNTARYPIIMSAGKVKQTLNYRFGYTSMEALNAFVNYNGL